MDMYTGYLSLHDRLGVDVTEIKICGITDRDDALFAAESGVDALGFIFYPPSPRSITPAKASDIIASLPREVSTVGVFVNQDIDEVRRIADLCGLDFLQLHGDETPSYCSLLPASRVIKACFLHDEGDLEALKAFQVRAVLVDSRDAGHYGGTGKRANWDLAHAAMKSQQIILAGGLCKANIGEALDLVSPPAVDINSGVESAPGKKDRRKILQIEEIIRCRKDGKRKEGIFLKPELAGY